MLAIAASDDAVRPMSVTRIADSMAIPPRILPSVMRALARAGLVEAYSGRAGGYRMAMPAASISLLTVIEAVEGDTRRRTCVLRGGPCGRDGHCAVHDAFYQAQDALRSELARAMLGDIVANMAADPQQVTGPG